MPLQIRPITFKQACAFVASHHRHNKPPIGHKFSISVQNENKELIGVAMIGRPVARHFDDGLQAEVNRTCLDPNRPNTHDNANSMLYGAAARCCKAMGYTRLITYTQADESGSSLKGAGFVRVKELEARGSWAESSVKLKDKKDIVGNGGIPRVLWEMKFEGNKY